MDLLLGNTLTGLLWNGHQVVGATARTPDGGERQLQARLVIGADGYRSKTAELAGAEVKTYPNSRIFLYAYYRDVPWQVDGDAALWWHADDWAVLAPTDGGLTEVALMPTRAGLPSGGADVFPAFLEDYFAALPGGPDLRAGERASKVVASLDYPLLRRNPTPEPGVALIGDAALTSDPAPAPGCTWALLSGQWLADHTVDALSAGSSVARALHAYRRAHRRLEREFFFMRTDAASGTTNPFQRLLRNAAVTDPMTAQRLMRVGMQVSPTTELLRPAALGRAWRVQHWGPRPQSERERSV